MSQTTDILKALKRGRKMSAIKALSEFGCFRLAARIDELKSQGYNIVSRMVKSSNDKRFAEYRLIK